MKFLCDVHISYKLAKHIESLGHEAIHINTILDKWFTKDNDIAQYANLNDYIVISKDVDFRDSHFLKKLPRKLIKINLGNISNDRLTHLFSELLPSMEKLDTENAFLIELDENNFNFIN